MAIRAIEFYSGIGGLHRALKRSGVDAVVVRAFDWDQTACRVYEENYAKDIVEKTDISALNEHDLASLDASLWLLSPSCQPYTVLNPSSKGAEDPRAKSFIHLIRDVLPKLVQSGRAPKWILVENVAGFETSSTRNMLVKELDALGFATTELLLTPLQFGIPNSRLRYYMLAKLRPLRFANSEDSTHVWRNIPGNGDPWVDCRHELSTTTPIRKYLDPDSMTTNAHLTIPDRVLERWGRLFDIVLPFSHRTCCFTRAMEVLKELIEGYTQMVERGGSILQMNEKLDTTETFDKFLEAQGNEVDDAVSILHPLQLRYFSPSELLRVFHFTDVKETSGVEREITEFAWPNDVSEKSKYRLLGNSVNVEVVRRLIEYLFEGDPIYTLGAHDISLVAK